MVTSLLRRSRNFGLGLCGAFLLISCTNLELSRNTVTVEDVKAPLQYLQRTVVSILPMGLRGNSRNGREFQSKYFVVSKGVYKEAGEAADRYYAHFTILGERRPYNVEVYVTHEQRTLDGNELTYRVIGHDSRLAKELAQSLRNRLTKRREDLNIIDDFRAF